MSVVRYAIKRFGWSIPVFLGVSLLVFSLVHIAPGGPVRLMLGSNQDPALVASIREDLGLNEPLWKQYVLWMLDAVQGDFGQSWTVSSGEPVTEVILNRLPLTLELMLLSMVVANLIAIPAGVISAVRKDKPTDHVARVVALAGIATPDFWLGIMLILIFGVTLQLPWAVGGFVPFGEDPIMNLKMMIFPVITLGTAFSALIMRMTRSEMADVLSADYIRTARAMGIGRSEIVLKDALKNAFIPVLTVIGVGVGHLMSGAIITETVFDLPGMGRLFMVAITRRDYRIIQALVIFVSFSFIFINLAIDIAYAYLDPRIRYEGRK